MSSICVPPVPAPKRSSVSAVFTERSMFSVAHTKMSSVFAALAETSSVMATIDNESTSSVAVATIETPIVSGITEKRTFSIEIQAGAKLCVALILVLYAWLVHTRALIGGRTLRVIAIFLEVKVLNMRDNSALEPPLVAGSRELNQGRVVRECGPHDILCFRSGGIYYYYVIM